MSSPHGVVAEAYRPPVMGRNGMVASGHPLASQAGVRALMAGGNAVDAAVATAAALGVVEPESSGIGGDGFITIYMADRKEIKCVNGTGPAPGRARRELFLKDGIPMKGILSVSVPGLVDGWLLAHEKYGRLKLDQVFEPVYDLCENGFPLGYKLARCIRDERPAFAEIPTSRPIFTRDGRPLGPGETLVQKDLGRTFRRIAAGGSEAFYRGEIAKEIVRFSEGLGGLLTEKDLADFHARWDDPISTTYRDCAIYEFPPNSSGHVLLQELNVIEQFDIRGMGCNSAEGVHVMAEAKRMAFADREKYLADPDHVTIPLRGLLSKSYGEAQAGRIDRKRAMADVPSGGPERHQDTTCFCAVDRWGNAVSQLQSVQGGFGSGLIAGNTGILLNNRMTYWHLEEDHVDCLRPGKRVRHTMNPVVALKGDRLFLVCGTPGADTQVQTNMQLLSHVIDFGMNPQEAVEAPRWRHLQNGTESTVPHTCADELRLEGRFPEEVRRGLAEKGHPVTVIGDWAASGSAMMIMVHPETGALVGGADPRRDGYVIGY